AAILEKRIREKISITSNGNSPLDIQRKITLAKAIGFARLHVLHEYLFNLFADPNPEVVKQAVLAAGDTLDPVFIERLVRFFEIGECRVNAELALASYGHAVVPELKQLMEMPGFPLKALHHVPKSLRLIPSQPTVNFL